MNSNTNHQQDQCYPIPSEADIQSKQRYLLMHTQGKWLQEQEQLPNTASPSSEEELRKVIGQLSTLPNADQQTFITRLNKVSQVLEAFTKIRTEDLQLLSTSGARLAFGCKTSFKLREANYTWWNRTVVFYHHLSRLMAPVALNEVFDSAVLEILLKSLWEQQTAEIHPDGAQMRDTNLLVLKTLANVVGKNPVLAFLIQTLDIADILAQIAPIKVQDHDFVEALAEFVSHYVRNMPYYDSYSIENIQILVHQCLTLDLNKHTKSVSMILGGLSSIYESGEYRRYPAWECAILSALADLCPKIQSKVTLGLDQDTTQFLLNFTSAIAAIIFSTSFIVREGLKNLLRHSFWEALVDRLLDDVDAINGKNELKKRLALFVAGIWCGIFSEQSKLAHNSTRCKIPFKVAQLTMHIRIMATQTREIDLLNDLVSICYKDSTFDQLKQHLTWNTNLLCKWTENLKIAESQNHEQEFLQQKAAIQKLADTISELSTQVAKMLKENLQLQSDGNQGNVKPLMPQNDQMEE